ncbi:MAG: UDP-N-acetylmuramoyl-L-alanyl-D-glutamate--2,6-diaminopimelate ligase [Phycisphaerales bacterium]|jgi:UDP-N-acetylmuramoyl-L-alanyl-D-glutamate--2,6-diaminopimelate ligase|nr:UDP-N-acetylmuramoyl-L-alanyl-D-glutamate--2,6-diaminopimelate ligase [Phycisphaerales bacterium]
MHTIQSLITGLDARMLAGKEDVSVLHVAQHSQRVTKGSLFIARSGVRRDGSCFIEEAMQQGAVAILCTPEVAAELKHLPVACIATHDPTGVGAQIAERFYGNPSKKLQLVGVTGTNGKTTISWMLRHVLLQADVKCGLLGTVVCDDGATQEESNLTTPSFCDTSKILASMVDNGCQVAVMECSSHALDQRRTSALTFEIGVFTNLSGDHLDYHGSPDAYLRAKMKLFDQVKNCSIVNMDDPASWAVADRSNARVVSCRVESDAATAWVEVRSETVSGSTICLHGPWGAVEVVLPLFGRHNAINALQAATCAFELGVPIRAIVSGLQSVTAPPGRLERVEGESATVFVDFAHTDAALEHMLWSLREVLPVGGNLIVVFGCGGDRDRSKRSRMGHIASTVGDFAFATSDNPRSENPQVILDQVLAGVPSDRLHCVKREVDRKAAIESAIEHSEPCDIVVIAGKGHERTQILQHEVIPFDDREIAAQAIRKRALEHGV